MTGIHQTVDDLPVRGIPADQQELSFGIRHDAPAKRVIRMSRYKWAQGHQDATALLPLVEPPSLPKTSSGVVRSRDANDSGESSAMTTEKRHERSIEFWSRTGFRGQDRGPGCHDTTVPWCLCPRREPCSIRDKGADVAETYRALGLLQQIESHHDRRRHYRIRHATPVHVKLLAVPSQAIKRVLRHFRIPRHVQRLQN